MPGPHGRTAPPRQASRTAPQLFQRLLDARGIRRFVLRTSSSISSPTRSRAAARATRTLPRRQPESGSLTSELSHRTLLQRLDVLLDERARNADRVRLDQRVEHAGFGVSAQALGELALHVLRTSAARSSTLPVVTPKLAANAVVELRQHLLFDALER